MASEQFSLCWDNFHKNMSSGMNSLLESEDLVDVTLAVEGKFLKAHKMVLSVCSPYFKDLFKSMNPYQHPVVFMKDVSYVAISDLLQFMYQGEVQVSQENLTTFIKTAEALQIKGLTGDGNGSLEADNELPTKNSTSSEPQITQMPRPKVQRPAPSPVVSTTPVTKKPRLSQSSSSNSEPAAPLVPTKQEPITPVQPEAAAPPVHFKMEPYDQNQSVTIPDDDDQDTEQGFDDTHDDTEDYSMMEGDEPQAGTSTDGAGEGQEYVIADYAETDEDEVYEYMIPEYEQAVEEDDVEKVAPINENECIVMEENEPADKYEAAEENKLQPKKEPTEENEHTEENELTVANEPIEEKKPKVKPNMPRYIVDGFVFHVNIIKGDPKMFYLRCLEYKRKGCHARAMIPADGSIQDIKVNKPHNHPPDFAAEEKIVFTRELKEVMWQNPTVPSRTIYQSLAELYPNAAKELPYDTVRFKMLRWKKQEKQLKEDLS